jgi:Kelch motif
MSSPRAGLSATTLLDGKVLIAGGNNGTADLASAEIYDPAVGTFSGTGSLARRAAAI